MLFLDDIIKQNRSTRRNDKRGAKKAPAVGKDQKNRNNGRNNRAGNRNGKRSDKDDRMMDTTPIGNNQVQKHRAGRRNDSRDTRDSRDSRDSHRRGNLVIRSNSGRAPGARRSPVSASASRSSGTAGLRQPWEKLPTAPIPSEPLKISIRNELAEKPARRSDVMMDTDAPSRPAFGGSSSAASYEPRDALASREEYRIGNRFSTQGMAIDYQLPSGASFDTRPTRRY